MTIDYTVSDSEYKLGKTLSDGDRIGRCPECEMQGRIHIEARDPATVNGTPYQAIIVHKAGARPLVHTIPIADWLSVKLAATLSGVIPATVYWAINQDPARLVGYKPFGDESIYIRTDDLVTYWRTVKRGWPAGVPRKKKATRSKRGKAVKRSKLVKAVAV